MRPVPTYGWTTTAAYVSCQGSSAGRIPTKAPTPRPQHLTRTSLIRPALIMARNHWPASARSRRGSHSTTLARGMSSHKPSAVHANCFTGERPQGIRKPTPPRRSARLQQRRAPDQSHLSLKTPRRNGPDAHVSLSSLHIPHWAYNAIVATYDHTAYGREAQTLS